MTGFLPSDGVEWRLAFYAAGMLLCALGVSLFFHTYLSPENYELLVKEISEKRKLRIDIMKTVYDCCSCFLGILLSFAFWGIGHFEGVKIGTHFLCDLYLKNRLVSKLRRSDSGSVVRKSPNSALFN